VEVQPGEFVDDDDFAGDLGGALQGNDRFESVVVNVDQFGTLYNFTESIAPSMVSKRLFLGNANGSLFAIPGTQRLTSYDLVDPGSAAAVYGDTNADGLVTALDALRVLNSLQLVGASGGSGAEGESAANTAPRAHLDVNRDGLVTALDALSVLNLLSSIAGGEAELSPAHGDTWEQAADQFMANQGQDEEDHDALLELLAVEASKTQG
ncbi:MAG: dockerin type I domain-containing protein, partial [Rubripirellula sp.]